MNNIIKENKRITVCIRKKPAKRCERDIIEVSNNNLSIYENKKTLDCKIFTEKTTFKFDKAFGENVKNEEVFESCKPVLQHVINGGNGTIIAYGQTGTGKTHTMFHPSNGIVFQSIKEWLNARDSGVISFYEIYNGYIYDLVGHRERIELREKEGRVYFSNIEERRFHSIEEAFDIINNGMLIRRIGRTGANNESSRSHAILRITSQLGDMHNEGNVINFVDLAGSERGCDRKDVNKLTRNEGAEINKSLLALKECIRGIDNNKKHLPFRQSKLTQVLKNSLMGNSKTILIATINPSADFVEHTMNTLQYAYRINESFAQIDKSAKKSLISINSPTKEKLDFSNYSAMKEDNSAELRNSITLITTASKSESSSLSESPTSSTFTEGNSISSATLPIRADTFKALSKTNLFVKWDKNKKRNFSSSSTLDKNDNNSSNSIVTPEKESLLEKTDSGSKKEFVKSKSLIKNLAMSFCHRANNSNSPVKSVINNSTSNVIVKQSRLKNTASNLCGKVRSTENLPMNKNSPNNCYHNDVNKKQMLQKRIEKISSSIKNECDRISNVSTLEKAISMLKTLEKNISLMKF